MRSQLESMFKDLGLEIMDQDDKGDYGNTRGYLVVGNTLTETFYKIEFYDDSYGEGTIDGIRKVNPKPVNKVEYL